MLKNFEQMVSVTHVRVFFEKRHQLMVNLAKTFLISSEKLTIDKRPGQVRGGIY